MKVKTKKNSVLLDYMSCLKAKMLLLVAILMLGFSTNVHAQGSQTISGKVVDDLNEVLIGVTVSVKGTGKGTITDVDGAYKVAAQPGDVLVFSYVGMKAQEVTVANQTTIDIVMESDAKLLTETVVIGYGKAKKRDLAGSIVSITAEDIANRPSANPLASLQGKVSGVQIVNTGRAGQDPEIRIRGTNSINGYKPLYVVDGLFHDNINFLNAADIESMEVLKDPSSLAIFGVRGANGVIIVTTKKAKEGKTVVNINSSVGVKTVANKMKMVDGYAFREMYTEQLGNQWMDSNGTMDGFTAPDFSLYQANTDWQDEIFQTAMVTDNNVSVSGSTDRSNFYLGVGYMYEQGNIKHERYNRVTVNLASDYKITKDFTVGYQFNGARVLPPDARNVENALRAAPISEPYNTEHGVFNKLPWMQKAQISNPLLDIEDGRRTNRAENYVAGGNVYADWDILSDKLNFRVMYGIDYRTADERKYTPLRQLYDFENQSVETLGDAKTAINQKKQDEIKIQSDYILTYNDSFGDHNITATAGFTTFYNRLSSLSGGRKQSNNIPISGNPNDWYVSLGDPSTATNGSEQWEKSTLSYLLRGLYNYKSKYIFNASFRRDGTSAFKRTGNQWQNFYSFGAGWVLTEEEFMRDIKGLDNLKLKGSWGTLGIQDVIKAYPANPLWSNDNSVVLGNPETEFVGYNPSYIVDRGLKWEKVEAWEVGLEAYFLKNKLYFDAVYYNKRTKDMMITVSNFAGSTSGLSNRGEVSNRGFEFAASWNDNIGANWRYGISANLSTIKNKVENIETADGGAFEVIAGDKQSSYTRVGQPIGFFYGYKTNGIYQNQAEIDADLPMNFGQTRRPGDLRFVDVNGDGVIDTSDRTMIGNPTPDFTYGLSLNLGYRNFDLSVDFMGVSGNEIYRIWDNYNWSQFNYMEQRLGRWRGEGTSNTQPILNTSRTNNNLNSDYYIEDGSFFRIRNIQLSYTFDQTLVQKLRMSALRLYFNAQNPVTWKNNTGYTPEIGGSAIAFGIDDGTYPMPAVYTFGVNVTF